MIGDQEQALVSSADLTRDQLVDEFDAGVYTKKEFVADAIDLFDETGSRQSVGASEHDHRHNWNSKSHR